MKKRYIFLITLGFIFILLGSIWAAIHETYFTSWNLAETGQIGDTIGGITAPIINVVGSLLIFISFLEQNKANKIQSEQNSFNLLHELFKDLKSELSNLSFSTRKVSENFIYTGSKAQSVFIEILESRIDNSDFPKNSFFKEYLFLTGNVAIFIDIVNESSASEKEKTYILRLFHFLYLAKIKTNLLKIIELTNGKTLHTDFNILLVDTERKIETNYLTYFKIKK